MDKKLTDKIRARYDRNAIFYDSMDRMIRDDWRKEVIGKASGAVLEVGVGTGQNLKFYDPGKCDKVTAIDFSPGMLRKAHARAEKASVPVELIEMDAQKMSFSDHTFDSAVSTCVFCSVPLPVEGLKEINRVVKPGGDVYFLEHMRVDKPVIGPLMDLMNPISVGLMGVNINRRTIENIEAAGLEIVEIDNVIGTLLRFIHAKAGNV